MTGWRRLTAEHGIRRGRVLGGDRAEAWATLELRNISRLTAGLYWWDETTLALDVSWGHRGSDPVWSFGLGLRLPLALADWLGMHHVGS